MADTRILRPYHFVDKNPVIDVIRTAIQDEGLINRLQVVADLASLSYATIDGWLNGDTRDPRHSSTMAVMISLGYENKGWVKGRKLNLEKELEFARAWLIKERARRLKAEKAPARKHRIVKKRKKVRRSG
jgi:hypothetical protein